MAETASVVSNHYWKQTVFKKKRNFFRENGVTLMPNSFDLVTSQGNEFHYVWEVEYLLLPGCVEPETDNDESESMEIDVNHYHLNKVEVRTQEKMNGNDTANIRITVNKDVCLDVDFDSNSNYKERNLGSLMVKKASDSYLQIKIKIRHQTNSIHRVISNYSKFVENEDFSDVKFIVGDKVFPAQKQIISESNSVFRAMLESDMLEKKNGQVVITDIDSNIFKLVLQFIYWEKVDTDELDDYLKLMIVADKYAMTSLLTICENIVAIKLTPGNVIGIFLTADLVKAETLKKRCVKFIFKNRCQIVKTEAFNNLVISGRADLISEIMSCN